MAWGDSREKTQASPSASPASSTSTYLKEGSSDADMREAIKTGKKPKGMQGSTWKWWQNKFKELETAWGGLSTEQRKYQLRDAASQLKTMTDRGLGMDSDQFRQALMGMEYGLSGETDLTSDPNSVVSQYVDSLVSGEGGGDWYWGQGAGENALPGATTTPQDINMESSLGDITNMPGEGAYSSVLPDYIEAARGGNWEDMLWADQAAQAVQRERQAAAQDRAANLMGQQLESARGLEQTPVVGESDLQRILGSAAGRYAQQEGLDQQGINESLANRGIGSSSGAADAMRMKASLARQSGMADTEANLRYNSAVTNRQGMESALGLQSSYASNLANVLTGGGPSSQWQLPAADYYRTLQQPQWLGTSGGGNDNAAMVGSVLQGLGGGQGIGSLGTSMGAW